MIFIPIASSSHGNAYVASDGSTKILIEAGIPYRRLQKECCYPLSQISGVLISHEHGDHAKCVSDLLKRGMDVFMSEGTANSLELDESLLAVAHQAKHREPIDIGTMTVVPFNVFHDAQEPLGYLLQSRKDGDVLVFATDTVNLRYQFPGVNILAIEANYEESQLSRCTRIPGKTVKRIRNTHMEIDTLCDILRHMDLSRCRAIFLMHLSDGNSHEEHFINKVRRAVPGHVQITVCQK